ncbi:P-type conjugative transfer ATPase TrbB [Caulobacter rhizosphaerae]|uniref:P-type conjugative transfer ATPase TrbB n=1 Tax=Caulobacter rhizosphaerae TaxID=2010972 RepID=UPI0013D33ACE|nr:P-type conjugative transfer ATPase TrbB [Caulobacter rhizosphaerae]GGL35810.1 P-type conjugative transfer ATPase TrbB [Caulobacter rhizosphaerae]
MNPGAEQALNRKDSALRQALGPVLASALAEASVVEVMVNPDGAIWIERIGQGRTFSGHHMARADAERVLRLVADHVGEVVTRERPLVGGALPRSGERFQGVFPPIAAAPSFSIRKRPERVFSLQDYVDQAIMSAAQADVLAQAAERRDNILIAGGTGSGKTTLANAILALPAFRGDRVILAEDTAELQCVADDQLALLTKRSEPAVTMADLVRAALRLRPDRIVVGEVRDGSALDMLKAWNTGHPGGLATLHANSAAEALNRLEDLIGEVAPAIPHRAIGQAIDIIAFIKRAPAGRMLESVVRVEGWRDGAYALTTMA